MSCTENISRAARSLAAEEMLILAESISLPEFQISTVCGEYARATHQIVTLLGQPVWETRRFKEEDRYDCSPTRKLLMEQNTCGSRSQSPGSTLH